MFSEKCLIIIPHNFAFHFRKQDKSIDLNNDFYAVYVCLCEAVLLFSFFISFYYYLLLWCSQKKKERKKTSSASKKLQLF